MNLFAGPSSIIAGLSVTFRTGSAHALESGAIVKEVTAIHLVVGRQAPYSSTAWVSVSTQIATLRRLLLNAEPTNTETGKWFKKAAQVGILNLMLVPMLNVCRISRGRFLWSSTSPVQTSWLRC